MSLKIGSKEFSKEQTIFLAAGAALVVTLILVFIGVLPGGKRGEEKISISVWVLDEDTEIWDPILIRFENSYPDINATLEEIAPGNYENELLNALAAGRGPDVFMFNSKWLIEHGDKIAPAPSNKMTAETFSGFFPQVAEQDFVSEGRIYAMPLFVDTLALLYNRDIFDAKGVVFAPGTWKEFEEAVAKLRTFENGKMGDKAAAIGGTSASVSNAVDLVGLLMLQNGSTIVNESFTRADFGREGEAGLLQYTKFADPQSPLYTWDDSLGLSNEVFANGEVAMAFA
ncbi:MAG: MalE-like protein maltose/maltodextrin ABC transporter, partial [Parcubacteria group bacterium GW2011_GWB1_45_7]